MSDLEQIRVLIPGLTKDEKEKLIDLVMDELQYPGITKRPSVCGGRACLAGTRITVWGLEAWRRQGLSDADIRSHIPSVTESQLEAAWRYVQDHRDEIDADIRTNEAA